MERVLVLCLKEGAVITKITEINTKQDLSRWTRAHADAPGITWSVSAGPGGTMIIVEHEEDRASLDMTNVSPDELVAVASPAESSVSPGELVAVASPAESADTVNAGELVGKAGKRDRARLRRRQLQVYQRPLLPELSTRGMDVAGRPRYRALDAMDQSPCSLLGSGFCRSDMPI
jgi:hypothetical protein